MFFFYKHLKKPLLLGMEEGLTLVRLDRSSICEVQVLAIRDLIAGDCELVVIHEAYHFLTLPQMNTPVIDVAGLRSIHQH